MSWLFSQALVGASLVANFLGGEQCAQLNVKPTQHKFWRNDRTMEPLSLSQFGATCAVLTDAHGEELLTSYLEGFRAKTSAQQEKALELTEHDQGFGEKWQELSVRYDPASSSWRTHRSLWDEDLPACSLTLPTWGLMRNGVLWERRTWAHHTTGKDVGLWPTPRKQMTRPCKPRLNLKNQHKSNLEEVVALEQGANGGRLNPTWIEWLMGWPINWTDSQPLETGKFQQWQQQHG
jgi:hypothetical protein